MKAVFGGVESLGINLNAQRILLARSRRCEHGVAVDDVDAYPEVRGEKVSDVGLDVDGIIYSAKDFTKQDQIYIVI